MLHILSRELPFPLKRHQWSELYLTVWTNSFPSLAAKEHNETPGPCSLQGQLLPSLWGEKNGIFLHDIIWMQFDNEDLHDLEMPDLSQPCQLCSLPHATLTSPSLANLRPHLMLFPSSSSLLISWGLGKNQISIFKDTSTALYDTLMWGRWTDLSKLVWPHNHGTPWGGKDPQLTLL